LVLPFPEPLIEVGPEDAEPSEGMYPPMPSPASERKRQTSE